MVSAPARRTDAIRVIFQSIFKVPKKTAFCEVRNDLGGSQKNDFFVDFLIIQIVLKGGPQIYVRQDSTFFDLTLPDLVSLCCRNG